jgi:hypothetical protein
MALATPQYAALMKNQQLGHEKLWIVETIMRKPLTSGYEYPLYACPEWDTSSSIIAYYMKHTARFKIVYVDFLLWSCITPREKMRMMGITGSL